jgi:hypothetical protein
MSAKKIAIEVGGEIASDAKAASDTETLRESEEDSDEDFISVGGKAPRVGQNPTNTFGHQSVKESATGAGHVCIKAC